MEETHNMLASPEKRRQQAKARNEEFLRQFPVYGITGRYSSSSSAAPASGSAAGVSSRGGGKEKGDGGGEGEGCVLLPLDRLFERWPGRERQIRELAGLIGEPTDGVPVPPILLTGPPCTGKTGVVRAVLDHRGCPYVHVNCAEAVQKRRLLEAIVQQVAGGSREDILEVNRVERSFRDCQQHQAADAEEAILSPVEDEEGPGNPSLADEDRQEQQQQQQQQHYWNSKGRSRLTCSSWNVFFRQLAALLHRRALAAAAAAAAEEQKRKRKRRGKNNGDDDYHDAGEQQQRPPPGGNDDFDDTEDGGYNAAAAPAAAFPRKVFVVLDNAELLLGEFVAGVGVGAAGGTSWRGADLLERLGRLPEMVSSFYGFGATPRGATTSSFGLSSGGGIVSTTAAAAAGATDATTTPPLICPILISQNVFFASEIVAAGTEGSGGGKWGGGGMGPSVGRSFVGRVYPVQLRFEPYGPKELPEVLARTAHCFGVNLRVKGRENPEKFPVESRDGGAGGVEAGRELFRKMAIRLVASLRNETLDAWELGTEAARLWPSYRKMVEDGFDDAELAAGLKPLLKETTKRLHGEGGSSSSAAAMEGGFFGSPATNGKKRRKTVGGMLDLGLSRSGKFALVSAYLASHNARDADRDLFTVKGTKRSGRKSKTGANVGNAENLVEAGVQDLPEARDFQLERLLSIMSSIVAVSSADTRAANNMGSTELMLQVKSLTRLNLIRECGYKRKMFELDAPSYRCCVSKELADSVAKEIGLDLSQYLKMG